MVRARGSFDRLPGKIEPRGSVGRAIHRSESVQWIPCRNKAFRTRTIYRSFSGIYVAASDRHVKPESSMANRAGGRMLLIVAFQSWHEAAALSFTLPPSSRDYQSYLQLGAESNRSA